MRRSFVLVFLRAIAYPFELMTRKYILFYELPRDFLSPVEASICFCEFHNRILLLKRHPHKWCGNTWNVPGGKLEPGESPLEAALRETYEEAGVLMPQSIEHMWTLYLRSDNQNSILHLFRGRFDSLPSISLREGETVDFAWKTVSEAYSLPLINGGEEMLRHYQQYLDERKKPTFMKSEERSKIFSDIPE